MQVAERSGWLSWLRWGRKGATPVLGVDIAPDGVRIVEVQASARGHRISHHAELPLANGAWQSALDGDPQALADALKRALKASGTRLRTAALALPASAVITRTLCLPQPAHDEELEMLVEAEAAQSLPFPRDEISLDFETLGTSANDEGMVDVLLVAARSESIAQRVAWAEAAGLKPAVVSIESQAVVKAIDGLCGNASHAESIVYFSAAGSHCLFVRGERLLFERELGKPLPPAAGHGDGAHAGELDSWLDAASLEWQRHRQLFAAAAGDGEIDRLHLAGAGALGPQLAAGLRQRLGIDVHVPDPFHYWPCLQRPARDPGNPGRGGEQGHEQVDGRAHERARHQTHHPDHHQPNDGGGASCLLACGLALHGLRA